jgi:sporulation protein YlmC with PRC-barrel domain
MNFKQKASVSAADGQEVGRIDRVVIDPETKKVTHVVVRKGLLFADDRVVPIGLVAEATEDHVNLRRVAGDLHNLPKFEESHYVQSPEEEGGHHSPSSGRYASPLYGPPPAAAGTSYPDPGLSGPQYAKRVEQNIPEGTVALREGAKVIANDGKLVGHVEEILTDIETEQALYILISKGLVTKERKLIPALWVREIDENEIYLTAPAEVLAKLRPYEN